MKTSPLKSKVLACKRQVTIRSKILIDNIILEEVNLLTYLECKKSHKDEKDIT
jgi:hypothetical protein